MNLDSMQEILDAARKDGKPMWLVVLEADMEQRGVTREQSMAKMKETWQAMLDAATAMTASAAATAVWWAARVRR